MDEDAREPSAVSRPDAPAASTPAAPAGPVAPASPAAPVAPDPAARSRWRAPVPPSLDRLAALSWRLLVVIAAAALVLYLLVILRVVVLPVIGALFLSTLLVPLANRLRGAGWPRLAAAWAVFGAFLLIVLGVFGLFVPMIANEMSQVRAQASEGLAEVRLFLNDRFNIDQQELSRYLQQARDQFAAGGGGLTTTGVISGARLVGEIIAGIIVAMVLVFFFVKDSDTISRWLLDLVGPRYRRDAREVGRRASTAIGGYIRGVAIVGFVDGFLIGLGLVILGVPLALPLAVLTFVGAFLPLVGAFVAGVLAALVALVAKGPVYALIVIAITVGVQQLEGHILAPMVLGRAVKLHPIAVLLALGAGSILGGIAGAFLSVPVAATIAAVSGYLRERRLTAPGAVVTPGGTVEARLGGSGTGGAPPPAPPGGGAGTA